MIKHKRKDHELPQATEEWGWKYHHIGIPTDKSIPGEKFIPYLKMYVGGFYESPYGIEWMRFEKDCPLPDLVKNIPHIAFVVDNLNEALKGKEILVHPNEPSGGVRVAMIKHNGAPVELMEFGEGGKDLSQLPEF